jgi:hypothetical protein
MTAQFVRKLLKLGMASFAFQMAQPQFALATGLNWPTNRLLPAFSAPVAVPDCIDVTSVTSAESDLFVSLQGLVNRTQPQLACVVGGQEGKFTWMDLHNLPYTLISGYTALSKYQTNVTGLVVTDPAVPDTLNLATTIAGVSNEVVCDPALLGILTNSPYNFSIHDDLRGRFADKYAVYRYLYTNYWPQCSHRLLAGMDPNVHGTLRDYLVALKVATVWLDPGNSADQSVLALFCSGMAPANSVYVGWWPSEGNGLNWIYQYGIPVLASDYFLNASLFGGLNRPVNVPVFPPPPPLQNKVYVAMILSDGDNIQYMQHAMKLNWENSNRGSIPLGWTVSPLAADMDPVMLNYYWSTATTNDCLISGPSGAGYTHMNLWNSANLAAFAKATEPYLERSGLRVITVWDQVSAGVARSFATNCPSLLGLTDQSGGNYTTVNLGLRTLGLTVAYSSDTNAIYSGITNAARNWNGSAPQFLAVQAVVWNLGPTQLRGIANALDTNKYVVVRPDHLFLLANSVYGQPLAYTRAATSITPSNAVLQGSVISNGTNTTAWFDWGTNFAYGSRTIAAVLPNTNTTVSAVIGGLSPRTTYHYRLTASNVLGVAHGADEPFTVGNRLKAWGEGGLGQTNPPAGVTNAVVIAAGANHALALKNDGKVIAWGNNSSGQTNVPASLSGVIEIAGGLQHSLALRSNGTLIAWGDNAYGQTNVPPSLTNVVDIVAGANHNLALRADGTVAAWGDNSYGQTNVPTTLTNVVALAAGAYHNLALKADGSVAAWGRNDSGQTNLPAGLAYVTSIAAGQSHSLALKADAATAAPPPARRWFADALSGSDGASIATWSDAVGGRNAVQNTTGFRPKLYSNVLNGHKAVRFASASTQYMTVSAADNPVSSAGSYTLVVVLKTSTSGAASSSFYQNTGLLGCEQPNVVPDWALCINTSLLAAGLGAGNTGCGSDLTLNGGVITDGRPHIAMCVRAGDVLSLYVDGQVFASRSSLCTAARGNYAFQIGAMTSSSFFYNGDIAEIQLFDRALSRYEIMAANESLAAAYGITGVAGRMVAWGGNSSGQTNVPPSLTNLVAVVSGDAFNLALSGDGGVIGWGNNAAGQAAPIGLTNVTALAAGATFGVALGNQIPLATDITVSGFVNHDVFVPLQGADPDANPFSFRVTSLPAAGALYQYSAGSRGPLIAASGTAVSDPSGRLVFAPAPGETGAPYAGFSFVAADAFYTSVPAEAAINIGLPASPQFTDWAWSQTSGVSLSFTGTISATYNIYGSTNLVSWQRLASALEASPGRYQFSDPAATNLPQRFYRAAAP